MIKKTLKKVIRKLGYDIIRYSNKKTRISKKLQLFNTINGKYYLPADAHQDIIAEAIKNDKIFDEEVYQVSKKYIKRGTVVLDVGSNFGQLAILFAGLVGEGGKVYAFDADDFIFEILKKNIELNNLSDIIYPVFGAVHDRSEEILYFPEQDFKRFNTYGSYGFDFNAVTGRKVESITIDDQKNQCNSEFHES